jgi:CDP-diacylglycerol--glycerol-3-phosphate 3-phosphatidyltransferase
MTTANKITIVRLLLIPVFVLLGVYYGDSVRVGEPQEDLRLAAILVFLVASVSDGLDGYIARRYNQRTKLGAILDPIADKGLLLAALLTLTFTNWGYHFPLWFPVLVIARDIVIVAGSFGLHYLNGDVHVHPRWTGKVATVFQMTAIAWVMLQFHFIRPLVPVTLAGLFTFVSGVAYVMDGLSQLQHAEERLAGREGVGLAETPSAETSVAGSPVQERSGR